MRRKNHHPVSNEKSRHIYSHQMIYVLGFSMKFEHLCCSYLCSVVSYVELYIMRRYFDYNLLCNS